MSCLGFCSRTDRLFVSPFFPVSFFHVRPSSHVSSPSHFQKKKQFLHSLFHSHLVGVIPRARAHYLVGVEGDVDLSTTGCIALLTALATAFNEAVTIDPSTPTPHKVLPLTTHSM